MSPRALEHPIVDHAIAAVDWSGDDAVLIDEGRVGLEAELRARFGKPDLVDAVRALLLFAFFLHEKKAAAASKAIVDVVQVARGALAAADVQLKDIVASTSVLARQRVIGVDGRAAIPQAATKNGLKWWQVVAKSDEAEE